MISQILNKWQQRLPVILCLLGLFCRNSEPPDNTHRRGSKFRRKFHGWKAVTVGFKQLKPRISAQ